MISVDSVSVRFRPYVEQKPTLRKSLLRFRHRETAAVVALDGVSFTVDRGEALGVIGRNGAGKSTLMRVLAGTLDPDEGSVALGGRVTTLLQLGVGFNPALPGWRNIYLGGLAAGLSRDVIDDIFDDIVDYSGLRHAMDRPVKTYSSGMSARLAFSIAMHLDPEIMLLDEVTSVGDQGFRQKSKSAMEDLLQRSGTIVLVSHSLGYIKEFCNRVAWLEGGSLRMVGPADDVLQAYRSVADESAAEGVPLRRLETEVQRSPSRKPKWPVSRKADVVLRLLNGDEIGAVSKEVDVPEERLEAWRDSFVAAGRHGLKVAPKSEGR